MELLRKVSAVNDNVIVVLFAGRPIEVAPIEALAKAVLYVWMPGTEGAAAITDVLFGTTEPTGRLAMSFPNVSSQEPLYYNRFQGGRPRNPGDPKAFRIGYIDTEYRPLHSFGYGLSYTTFSYSPVTIVEKETNEKAKQESNQEAKPKSETAWIASATVTNTGDREGTETVQLYIRDVSGSVVRPVRELKGFKKITLKPGESREVSFEITEPMLRFWRIDMTYGSEPGKFEVYIGADSTTENKASFLL